MSIKLFTLFSKSSKKLFPKFLAILIFSNQCLAIEKQAESLASAGEIIVATKVFSSQNAPANLLENDVTNESSSSQSLTSIPLGLMAASTLFMGAAMSESAKGFLVEIVKNRKIPEVLVTQKGLMALGVTTALAGGGSLYFSFQAGDIELEESTPVDTNKELSSQLKHLTNQDDLRNLASAQAKELAGAYLLSPAEELRLKNTLTNEMMKQQYALKNTNQKVALVDSIAIAQKLNLISKSTYNYVRTARLKINSQYQLPTTHNLEKNIAKIAASKAFINSQTFSGRDVVVVNRFNQEADRILNIYNLSYRNH